MSKRVQVVSSLLVVAALILSGCGLVTGINPEPVTHKPLVVEWTIWEGDYTILIAKEKGFFDKHGVEVNLVFYETFSGAVPDLAMNRLDGGLFGIGDLLSAATVTDAQAVAVYDSGGSSAVVANPKIQSIRDLKGKNIGVELGTSGEMYVRAMLQEEGLTINDVTLVDVSPEQVPDRLSADLAAGYVWAPYDQVAMDKGNKLLHTRGSVGSLFQDVIVFRSDVVRERPEDVRAFLDAWFEALDYRMANQAECDQIIAKVTGKPVEEIAQSGKIKLFTRQDNLALFDENGLPGSTIYYSAKVNLDFLVMNGSVTRKMDLHTVLNRSFLQ